MGVSCTYKPKVRNTEGELVDSILFKDLRGVSGQDQKLSTSIYGKTRTDDFQRIYGDKIERDKNGEPTIKSLFEKTDIADIISEKRITNALYKKAFLTDYKDYKYYTRAALDIAYKKCVQFNQNNLYHIDYVAKMDWDKENDLYALKIMKKTKENAKEIEEMEKAVKLHTFLTDTLEKYGISVGYLNQQERRMHINGVTDFNIDRDVTHGLIEMIRIAKGKCGQEALPEEFSHFIIAALKEKSPLVSRLINELKKKRVLEKILGDDFYKYNIEYRGDQDKLAEEAAGKLLAQKIKENFGVTENKEQEERHKSLFERIFDFCKKFFKDFDIDPIQKAFNEASNVTNSIAKDILKGKMDLSIDVKNISNKGKLFNVKRTRNEKETLEYIIRAEKEKLESLKLKGRSQISIQKTEARVKALEDDLLNNRFKEGIFLYVSNLQNTAKAMKDQADIFNKEIRANKGKLTYEDALTKLKVLKKMQLFIYGNQPILKDIRNFVMDFDFLTEKEKDDISNSCTSAIGFTESLQAVINNASSPLVYEFFKDYCPEKIEITTGKHKGEFICLADEINEVNGDINFKNRWFDSMEDSGDLILSIFSVITKRAKEQGRLNTIAYRAKIESITRNLQKQGVFNTSFMFEKDSDGKRTGKYISGIKSNDLSKAEKEYYDAFMEMKRKLDKKIPPYRLSDPMQTIKVRKDAYERIKATEGTKNKLVGFWHMMKEKVTLTENDIANYGAGKQASSFRKQSLQTLPLYMLDTKEGETEEDMSEDCSGCLLAYASMVEDYDQMNNIVDGIEMARDYLVETRQTNKLDWKGDAIKNKAGDNILLTDNLNWIGRIDDFINMQVFGNYNSGEHTVLWGKISVEKSLDSLNGMIAFDTLSGNLMSGVTNVVQGLEQGLIETVSGEYINNSDMLKADGIFFSATAPCVMEFGNPIKTNKLDLFDEVFNVLQKHEEDVNQNYIAGRLGHILTPSIGMVGQEIGERWLQNRTALALAVKYKMKTDKGEECNLWDALEVKYTDETNKTGAYLAIKDGYTKPDGSKFTSRDESQFSLLSANINNHMHGIYNRLDKSAIQKYAVGRSMIMFRKFLIPSINKRMSAGHVNIITGKWEEGYYRTAYYVLGQMSKNIKTIGLSQALKWDSLNETEKFAVRRTLTEFSTYASLCIIVFLLGSWGDNKDETWARRMTKYELIRMKNEVGALTMIPSPMLISSMAKICNSPGAVISWADRISAIFNLFVPSNYTTKVKSGEFKGDSNAFKYFMDLPLPGTSQYKMQYKNEHPEEAAKYFK